MRIALDAMGGDFAPREPVLGALEAARSLGSAVPAPFALLSFMALSVIPEARVTDRGLVVL